MSISANKLTNAQSGDMLVGVNKNTWVIVSVIMKKFFHVKIWSHKKRKYVGKETLRIEMINGLNRIVNKTGRAINSLNHSDAKFIPVYPRNKKSKGR